MYQFKQCKSFANVYLNVIWFVRTNVAITQNLIPIKCIITSKTFLVEYINFLEFLMTTLKTDIKRSKFIKFHNRALSGYRGSSEKKSKLPFVI